MVYDVVYKIYCIYTNVIDISIEFFFTLWVQKLKKNLNEKQ